MEPSKRLVSLDAFRGLTIAAMILVNNPGSWSTIYGPLKHAAWHGWTPTDLIFPFFLFIVGVAIVFAFSSRLEKGVVKKKLYGKIIRRTLILFGLGLFLSLFPYFEFTHMRIPGVLQRIALVYLFASIIVLHASIRAQVGITVGILVLYWILMTQVPVPGYGAGILEKEGNLAQYVDQLILAGHMWSQSKTWDPEGLLSTLPAIATGLTGVLTGHWLRSTHSPWTRARGMLAAGGILLVVGLIVSIWFPINKSLWTSSFVLVTSGCALMLLALLYALIDVKGYKKWTYPLLVYGMNPITVFVLSGLLAKCMVVCWSVTQSDGSTITLKGWIYQNLFLSWASPINASLFFALSYIVFWFLLMAILYHKRIFIKI